MNHALERSFTQQVDRPGPACVWVYGFRPPQAELPARAGPHISWQHTSAAGCCRRVVMHWCPLQMSAELAAAFQRVQGQAKRHFEEVTVHTLAGTLVSLIHFRQCSRR